MTLILHISDLHFGAPLRPERVRGVRLAIEELDPQVVVASGDLVQRADFASQFTAAGQFLRELPRPLVVVPGNHDLPVFNPLMRLWNPYGRYQRSIHSNLEPEHLEGDVLLLALNSTKPYLIHQGYTTGRQLQQLRQRIARHAGARTRVVTTHHPLVQLPDSRLSSPQYGWRRTLREFSRAGVELVLSGHFHSFRVYRASERCKGIEREVYMIISGSTTSSRIRSAHHTGNGFVSIEVKASEFRVRHYLFEDRSGKFHQESELDLPREAP